MNDWGPRFKRIAEIYGPKPDEEVDSEYEFPVNNKIPAKKKLPPPKEEKEVPYERLKEQPSPPKVVRGNYHEAVNPLEAYEQLGKSKESWC